MLAFCSNGGSSNSGQGDNRKLQGLHYAGRDQSVCCGSRGFTLILEYIVDFLARAAERNVGFLSYLGLRSAVCFEIEFSTTTGASTSAAGGFAGERFRNCGSCLSYAGLTG